MDNTKLLLTMRLTINKNELKPIPNFVNYYAYKDGRIYRINGDDCIRQLTEFRQPYSKYLYVYLYRNKSDKVGVAVHKLVASAFFGIDPLKYHISHKDRNTLNNKPENLEIKQKAPMEIEDEERTLIKEKIKEFEEILLRYVNFNRDSEVWQDYRRITKNMKDRVKYNWLKLYLISKDLTTQEII